MWARAARAALKRLAGLRQAGAILICFVVFSAETQLWPAHSSIAPFVKTEVSKSRNFECIDVFDCPINVNSAGCLCKAWSPFNCSRSITIKIKSYVSARPNICVFCFLNSKRKLHNQRKLSCLNADRRFNIVCWVCPKFLTTILAVKFWSLIISLISALEMNT